MLVQVLDEIRFALDYVEDYKYVEFCWFAREYPRAYRYHFNCAEFRLKSIYEKYQWAHLHFTDRLIEAGENCFQMSQSNHTVNEIYWDFESFLSAINTALDIIARVIGTAYKEQFF
jgi:hypothetical protein